MHLPFLTPRIDLLGGDGAVQTLHPGSGLGRLRKPILLIARDLSSFSHFETGALPRGRRRQAAALQARLASPYLISGAALVQAGVNFGIWWWDLERVAALIGDRYGATLPTIRPETMAQPPGLGWRLVRLATGYEAQFWRGRSLIASAWRRDAFDPTAWAVFTSLQRDEAAPEAMPQPESLPLALDSDAFSLARIQVSREQAIATAAGGFAITACLFAAFFLGQGLSLNAEIKEMEKTTAEMRQGRPRASATPGVETERQRLAAFRKMEERTSPVTAAGAAIGIVALYDLSPKALAVRDGVLTLTLPYTAVRRANELIADFEQSGYFYDIRPRTEVASQSLVIEAKVREAAPPLSAGG